MKEYEHQLCSLESEQVKQFMNDFKVRFCYYIKIVLMGIF